MPNLKSALRQSSTRQSQSTPRFDINAVKAERVAARVLEVDLHTQKDLEIFESSDLSKTLYHLCNSTRTEGGAQILRQRMEKPFADASDITQAQQAISYIIGNREAFQALNFWVAGRVEQYQKDSMMYVTEQGAINFAAGALTLRIFEGYQYIRILRGVQYSCLLVQNMRECLRRMAPNPPGGELAGIYQAMKRILSRPEFAKVPEEEPQGFSFLKVLHLDQIFRIHSNEQIEALTGLAYELDALVSMADATDRLGYVIPEVLEGPTRLHASALVHPQLENPVPNDVALDQNSRLFFLTGPNMAGKTTYLRAIATALYLGHLGMGVPAASFAFTPIDRLFCSIAISDDVHSGTSYFLAEVLRIKSLAHSLSEGHRVVAVVDEPFKGTNVSEAFEASLAVMTRLASISDSLFLFSSHLSELDERFGDSGDIMKCHFEAKENGGKLEFDYLLRPGLSHQRLGMRVLRDEGVFDLLDQVASTLDERLVGC